MHSTYANITAMVSIPSILPMQIELRDGCTRSYSAIKTICTAVMMCSRATAMQVRAFNKVTAEGVVHSSPVLIVESRLYLSSLEIILSVH